MSAPSPPTKERFVFVEQEQDPEVDLCPPAREMAQVCEAMLVKVRQAPDELAINIALLQLQQQYFLRYEAASKPHKNHVGSRNGHTCIFQIWHSYYSQLRELLLVVNPPPLVREVQVPPPQLEIAGVPFGIRK